MLRLLTHTLWCILSVCILINSSFCAVFILSVLLLLFTVLIVLCFLIILISWNFNWLLLMLLVADSPWWGLLSIDLVFRLKYLELIRVLLFEWWLRWGRFHSDWGWVANFTQVCVGYYTSCLLWCPWIKMSVHVRTLGKVVDVHLELRRLFD